MQDRGKKAYLDHFFQTYVIAQNKLVTNGWTRVSIWGKTEKLIQCKQGVLVKTEFPGDDRKPKITVLKQNFISLSRKRI